MNQAVQGLGDRTSRPALERIEGLDGIKIVQVAAGHESVDCTLHRMAFVSPRARVSPPLFRPVDKFTSSQRIQGKILTS